jgi:hypothetical protein
MAYYKPCKNCGVDKASCGRRSEIANAVLGLSVTVVNFRCVDRLPLFRAGQRVGFKWTDYGDGAFEEDAITLFYHGTVIEEAGLRFIVRVDAGPSADAAKYDARDVFKNDNLVIKVKGADMQALGEPDRRMCPVCSAYDDEGSRCQGWGTPGSWDSYWPDNCQHAPADRLALTSGRAAE